MNQKTFALSILGFVFAFMFAFAPSFVPVMAQPTGSGDAAQAGLNDIGQAFPEGAKRGKTVQEITKLVIDWALYLAAIIAVIFIIYGGFLYITSAGNATQAGNGRQTLVNALIGLTLVVLSYIIVQIVYNFLTKPI
jgi:hypothetical protein